MNRRKFLSLIGMLPLLGFLKPEDRIYGLGPGWEIREGADEDAPLVAYLEDWREYPVTVNIDQSRIHPKIREHFGI